VEWTGPFVFSAEKFSADGIFCPRRNISRFLRGEILRGLSVGLALASNFLFPKHNTNMLITPIDINMKFHSLELIEEYMKTIAKNNGFKLHVTRHKDASGIFYRGKFDCSYKDPNFKGNKKLKRTCSFSATFCKSGMTYEFTKCNYEHNHILKKPATIESGMIMKTKADELTGEEKTIVRDYCTKLDFE
jgi:hypothetical protein